MKALILAGGTGSRLRPFSHTMPKQLIPVANRPVLFYALDELIALGITRIGIVVNSGSEAISGVVGDGSRFGVEVEYLPQDEPRGLAHCVVIAREFLGDDDFLMFLGDNVFADGLAGAVEEFRRERPVAQLVLAKMSDPSEYGVAEVDTDGRVLCLEEKPARPRSDLAVTGAYLFSSGIHEAVDQSRPSWRGELEITDAIQWLVARDHQVRGHVYTGYWRDTGKSVDLLDCNRALLERVAGGRWGQVDAISQIGDMVVVEAGANVTASRIDGPAIVGAGTTIRNSYVGPYTAIGSGCLVENAGIEDSIMLDRSSVRNVRTLTGSVIGRETQVSQARRDLRVHRLVVGDDGSIEIPA